jgi:hypothetical protein
MFPDGSNMDLERQWREQIKNNENEDDKTDQIRLVRFSIAMDVTATNERDSPA